MVHSEPVGYTERPIEDSCQYLEMIIPSQNTQVSSFRDLFKGCNKASGPLAKTFHTGAQQCSGAHRVCEGSSCSSEGQIGLYNPTCTEKKNHIFVTSLEVLTLDAMMAFPYIAVTSFPFTQSTEYVI